MLFISDQIEIKFSFAKKKNYLENNPRDYVFINLFLKCVVQENIYTPTKAIFWGVGASVQPKNLKKCMKLIMIEISREVGGS